MKTQVTRRPLAALLASVLSLVVLSACQKQEGATPVGRAGAQYNAAWAQQAGITLNGGITTTDAEDYFREAVLGFVDPLCVAGCDRENWVGYVSPRAQGTGAFLGGRVEMQNGVLNPNAAISMNVRADSKVFVVIYDEYTGRPDPSGQVVPYISRAFTSAVGSVQGNHASLCFVDQFGVILMDGTFNAQNFVGSFSYDNGFKNCADFQSNKQPAPNTAAGDLGQFNVPTCQFFRCQ